MIGTAYTAVPATGTVEKVIADDLKEPGPPKSLTYVEIPVEYARWLVVEGKETSQRLGLPAPKSLAVASAALGSATPNYAPRCAGGTTSAPTT